MAATLFVDGGVYIYVVNIYEIFEYEMESIVKWHEQVKIQVLVCRWSSRCFEGLEPFSSLLFVTHLLVWLNFFYALEHVFCFTVNSDTHLLSCTPSLLLFFWVGFPVSWFGFDHSLRRHRRLRLL